MIAGELLLLGHPMLPHVVGELVAALYGRLQRRRIKLTNAARGEDRGLDAVPRKQLQKPPNANPATEFTLGQLHRRLVVEAAQQHGIEVDGQIDGNAGCIWPRRSLQQAKAAAIVRRHGRERVKLFLEALGHVAGLVFIARSALPAGPAANKVYTRKPYQGGSPMPPFGPLWPWAPAAECTKLGRNPEPARARLRQQTKGPSRMECRACRP